MTWWSDQADPSLLTAKVRAPHAGGVPRDHLLDALAGLWRHRLGLVVAPAGAGKTTLLAQFAGSAGVACAWYQAEAADGDAARFLAYLRAACERAVGGLASPWHDADDAVRALEATDGGVLLVIDDLHTLQGTPAEAQLERLVAYAPPSLWILAASRHTPGLNLPRLRVAGTVLEVGRDDLRFRAWEVERLFRDVYGEPLPPEDLVLLTQRTEGWAAALQLFHLATQGKPVDQRRRAVASLDRRSRLVREYLMRNVLDELPGRLREFLVETCVLGRLTGPLCDKLRNTHDSEHLLAELERWGVLTVPLAEDGAYRYHEVLRAHLDHLLRQREGDQRRRARYHDAAQLLEAEGALAEAVHAYCRAEQWARAGRLLARDGPRLAEDPGGWLEVLPPALRDGDPWVLVARARHSLTRGRPQEALAIYDTAVASLQATSGTAAVRRERAELDAWLQPLPDPARGWSAALRTALRRAPLSVAADAEQRGDVGHRLAAGLAALLAGHVDRAVRLLDAVGLDPAATDGQQLGGRLGAAIAARLSGAPEATPRLRRLADSLAGAGQPWLAGVARAAVDGGPPLTMGHVPATATSPPAAMSPATAASQAPDPGPEPLALALQDLVGAVAVPDRAQPAALDRAAAAFDAAGMAVLAVWARSAGALTAARAGDDVADTGRRAEALARTLQVPGALALAQLAAAAVAAEPSGQLDRRARAIADDCGLWLAPWRDARSAEPRERLWLGLLGGLRIVLDGHEVDCTALKPRARATLQLLALHAGEAVHREHLMAALWPAADEPRALRGVQVAVSAVRRLLEPHARRGDASLIVRDGDTYRLAVPPHADVDVWRFRRTLSRARVARDRGDVDATLAALGEALALYGGDLLPDAGPAEWVVDARDRLRDAAVTASAELARAQLDHGEPAAAVTACAGGLALDRYRDELWRLLIEAHDRAGDPAAAARSRQAYEGVLAELGVSG